MLPIPRREHSHSTSWDNRSLSKSEKQGLPRWLSGKESACQCRRPGFDPCRGRTNPLHHKFWSCALEPVQEPRLHPKASALQQEKPRQWESRTLQLESGLRASQLDQSPSSKADPAQPDTNKQNYSKNFFLNEKQNYIRPKQKKLMFSKSFSAK